MSRCIFVKNEMETSDRFVLRDLPNEVWVNRSLTGISLFGRGVPKRRWTGLRSSCQIYGFRSCFGLVIADRRNNIEIILVFNEIFDENHRFYSITEETLLEVVGSHHETGTCPDVFS